METWGISPNLGNITKEWAEEEALVETETESSEFGAGRGGGGTRMNYYQIDQRRRKCQGGRSQQCQKPEGNWQV